MFRSTAADNEVSLSTEDQKFLQTMEKEIHKNTSGHWEMPLPFRERNVMLPNNRSQAAHRLSGLIKTLKRKPKTEKDYLEFMEAMISKGHATKVPIDNWKGVEAMYGTCPTSGYIIRRNRPRYALCLMRQPSSKVCL